MRTHLTRQFPSVTTLACRTLFQSKDPIKLVSFYGKSIMNLYSSYSRSGMPQNNEFQLIKILKAILGKSPVDPFFSPRTRKMRYIFATVLFAGSLYCAFDFMTQKNLEGAAFIRQTLINLRLDPKVRK